MKNFKFTYLILLLFLIIYTACDKESQEFNDIDDFNIYLESQVEENNLPALAVLIFEGETIKYEKYLGYSDIENEIELTENHVFLLASISKMVTGTALLQLYEKGEFDLDDDIDNYLPFDVNVPNQTTPITFKMLLTHTSAIDDGPNAELFYSYGQDSSLGLSEYMEEYLSFSGEYYDEADNFHDYQPGSAYNYSNMASALIGVLVSEISNMDFKEYCKENIFQPLDMNNTFWSLDAAIQSNHTLVNPYNFENGEFSAIEHYTFADYPNGSLRSSTRDMMNFSSALAQGGTFNGFELLKSNTINEMLSSQIPNLEASMGLHAFELDKTNNLWGHNGGEQGVSTELGFNLSNNSGAIVLTNVEDIDVSSILLEAYNFGLKN